MNGLLFGKSNVVIISYSNGTHPFIVDSTDSTVPFSQPFDVKQVKKQPMFSDTPTMTHPWTDFLRFFYGFPDSDMLKCPSFMIIMILGPLSRPFYDSHFMFALS
jgi:hypothetical protein